MCPPVLQQLAAQLTGDQDRADFPLQRHLRPAAAGGLHGQVFHLTHPDSGGADGLHEQAQTLTAQSPGGGEQAAVLGPAQFPVGERKAPLSRSV